MGPTGPDASHGPGGWKLAVYGPYTTHRFRQIKISRTFRVFDFLQKVQRLCQCQVCILAWPKWGGPALAPSTPRTPRSLCSWTVLNLPLQTVPFVTSGRWEQSEEKARKSGWGQMCDRRAHQLWDQKSSCPNPGSITSWHEAVSSFPN